MSEVKVNKISPRTACGTVTLGDSGDTFTVPSGATISNLGTATGFGGTGVVSWDTASIKTTGFTAVTGTGYFCNTTGGAFTVTLPLSPSAGDVVGVSDYAKTWDTDNLTLGRNGSNIAGTALDSVISTEGLAVTLVYVDGTKGWIVTDSGLQSDAPMSAQYMAGTGGCITTCGDYKIHTFKGPGTFCVSAVGNPAGSGVVDYLVVAGGGGGTRAGGGAGGGGARFFMTSTGCYPAVLRNAPAGLTVPVAPYPITVGGGGPLAFPGSGTNGSVSTFSTITSAGGGGGGAPATSGNPGGTGGGGGRDGNGLAAGVGNTPPVSPSQGESGGISPAASYGGGGGGGGFVNTGGASAGGATCSEYGGDGGNGGGFPSVLVGSNGERSGGTQFFSGGGGGGANGSNPVAATYGQGGLGGGGQGGIHPPHPQSRCTGTGTDNTGGGGGSSGCGSASGANGGSGIVIIRYKFQ